MSADPSLWRLMRAADLPAVERIGDATYPDHHESPAILAERFRLHPSGCHVLDAGGAVRGYAVSHPWTASRVPALNTLLGRLPPCPTSLHIHDVALLPAARGAGAAGRIVADLLRRAGPLPVSLVAVAGSAPFWIRFGFRPLTDRDFGSDLDSYGNAAICMRRVGQRVVA